MTTAATTRSGAHRLSPRRRPRRLENGGFLNSGLLLLAPIVILEIAVFLLPLVYVLNRSFHDWQPGGVSVYVRFDNYSTLFAQAEFWEVVRNQLFFLLGLPIWVAAPLVLAYLLRENVSCAGLFRTIYFFPAVLSPAIVGLVFRSLLATDGPFNAALGTVGLGGLAQPWLTDATWVKPTVIVLMLWAGLGTGVLIFSAALAAVPDETFEAARIDGAGFWDELWHIAIPSVRATVVLWTMFQVMTIFLFMFSWIYVLTSGGPGLSSTTMDFSIYQKFVRFGFFGAAAAQSVVLVAMVIVVPIVIVVIPRAVRVVWRTVVQADRLDARVSP